MVSFNSLANLKVAKPVSSEPADNDQPAIEALTQDGIVRTYVKRDEGEHWDFLRAVG